MFGYYSTSGRKRPDFFCAALLAVWLITAAPAPHAQSIGPAGQSASLPRTTLQVGEHRIVVEVAADDASRSRGLMFRQQLAPDHGMLFMFPQAAQMCFWMKNTLLPLSIAFIDDDGIVVNLADMQPQSLDTHCAIAPSLYALEMEQGWFARQGVGPGTRVQGLPRFVQ